MRIDQYNWMLVPHLYAASRSVGPTRMETGSFSGILRHDTVELSSATARDLPDGVIEHEPAKMYFNEEIKATLEKVLAGKAPEVSKAVYQLIESNFFAANVDYTEEERTSLIAAGLTQAQFIADNYMQPDEAEEFMDTIHLLAAVAKTRTVDPETGVVRYVDLPQRPQGAPADYVRIQDLMKKYDPDAYAKLTDAVINGGNFASILIQFAKKLHNNPDWVKEYREEQENFMKELQNTKIENEFMHIRATSVQDFVESMRTHIENSSFANKALIMKNTMQFAKTLGV